MKIHPEEDTVGLNRNVISLHDAVDTVDINDSRCDVITWFSGSKTILSPADSIVVTLIPSFIISLEDKIAVVALLKCTIVLSYCTKTVSHPPNVLQ